MWTRRQASPVLILDDLRRSFRQGTREINVLTGASVALARGQCVALVGPSGAGKSTLLHIAGLLETPDSGRVIVAGADCAALDDGDRTRIRRAEMGFIYQFHQLLPEFSALENVAIPQMIMGKQPPRSRSTCERASVGARSARSASITAPRSFRAASSSVPPSAALSPTSRASSWPTSRPVTSIPRTSELVFHELIGLFRHEGVAALIATHNLELARRMDRVVMLVGRSAGRGRS